MRAEDRGPFEQYWEAFGDRQLRDVLASWGFGPAYAAPVTEALRSDVTAPELERLLGTLRSLLGDRPDEDADSSCAMSLALWWESDRHRRKRFGAR